jgi:hypothetical protein
LVAHVFFASYKRIDKNYKTPGGRNYFDLHARLNFGMGYEEGGNFGYRAYQYNCLTNGLDKLLNQGSLNTVADEVNALTDFLSYVWGLEKINLKPDFNKVGGGNDIKSVYALYPSCGGAITPMALYYSKEPSDPSNFNQRKLGIRSVNYVENSYTEGTNANNTALHTLLYKEGNNTRSYLNVSYKKSGHPIVAPKKANIGDDIEIPNFIVGGGKGYGEGPTKTITDFNDYEKDSEKFKKLLEENNVAIDNTGFSWRDNPFITQYFVDLTFDRTNFLVNYAFDNKTVLKNTTRFLWFDPTSYGEDLKQDYKLGNDLSPTELAENGITGTDLMINTFGEKDYFSLNLIGVYKYGDYDKLKEKLFFEQYTISNLMDSLDFEKLEEFTKLFLDFCKLNGKSDMVLNNTNHNLRSLMLSSSTMTYDDIADQGSWTKEDINLMLVGNSMFQYEFLSESGISTILNHSLSTAQYKIFNNVCDEFCSSLITVANFSPNTPIAFDNKSQSSLHKVISLPEILFSNRTNYDEILTLLDKTTDDDKTKTDKYFTRKILFGDQYIEPFTELTTTESTELKYLNYKYLLNKLYTYGNFDGDLNELYKTTVINFFRSLNIKYTEARYKQLHRLIRTYVYRIFKNNQILNDKSLPGQPMYPDGLFVDFKKDYNIG